MNFDKKSVEEEKGETEIAAQRGKETQNGRDPPINPDK